MANLKRLRPDSRYNSELISKFINAVMLDGKKSVATKIVYSVMDAVSEKANKEALEVFHAALENVKPEIEVKSRRVGGATYQVPVPVVENRAKALAFKWIVTLSRKRPERSMIQKMAAEIMDAYNNRGASVKKKEDTHKMAEANRAFAHYRW